MADPLNSTSLVCGKIKKLADTLASSDDKDSVTAKGFRLLLELKQLNRDVMFKGMDGKKEVAAKKKEQDQINLQLQGLQYEKSHFVKEINKCKDLQWQSTKPDLISKEEFVAEMGASVQGKDEHTLHLARLSHELKARRALLVTVVDLKAEREQLLTANAEKRKFLEGLNGRLGALFKDASAIQSMLPGGSQDIALGEAAAYLPKPLYNLYNVVTCYKRYYDENLTIKIEGDVEQARAVAASEEQTEQSTKRQKTSETKSVAEAKDKMSDGDDDTLTRHPLNVLVVSDGADAAGAMHLRFFFHTSLDVVTVAVTDAKDKKSLSPLLLNLYPDDSGAELPNNIGQLLTQGGGASALEIESSHGVPFRWAQALCGQQFDHPRVRRHQQCDLASVLARIQRRMLMRQSLTKQYASLQKKTFPFPVVSDEFPHKPKAVMSRWTKVDGDKFARACGTSGGGEAEEWWAQGAEYFMTSFSRGSIVLEAWVEVTAEYPSRPPRFKLFLPKGLPDITTASAAATSGDLVKATANPDVLAGVTGAGGKAGSHKEMFVNDLNDMETEVNNHFPCPLSEFASREATFQSQTQAKSSKTKTNENKLNGSSVSGPKPNHYLLSYQLRKLQSCLDILVQARKNGQSVRFLEASTGRDRRKPFVYSESRRLFFAR